ncbi:MAG: heme exporter protein CcmB [Ignavibacteriales bacterium]|nr:heme exporter protein CcmB [Ignavibacteriales bacterium]
MMMRSAYEVFRKDVHSEFRTRYAMNALIMFVIVALSIILFSIGDESVTPGVLSGILWVIIFFSGMSGLSRSFVSEEERGTVLTLQLLTEPSAVYAGKLLFNLILTVSLNLFIAVMYVLLVQQFVVQSPAIFWVTILLGSAGIAAAATILAAIIAKANTKGTLYPVLAFPIMLPLLLTVMNATRLATEGAPFSEAAGEFQVLVAYTVVVIAVSVILFDFVWKD